MFLRRSLMVAGIALALGAGLVACGGKVSAPSDATTRGPAANQAPSSASPAASSPEPRSPTSGSAPARSSSSLSPPATPSRGPDEESTSRGAVRMTGGAEWTVLVYMAADNNLERFALTNLEQMASVGSTDKVQVVAQVDRSAGDAVNQGVLNLPDWGSTKRLYVEKGNLKELSDLGQTNMADPSVLKEFIVWGQRTYPAKRYALVLWDHGGAWQGFATDDSSGGENLMSLTELAGALRGSGVSFDFLGFDACLMASVEVALELQPYGKILVASQEVEPGLGWDYSAVLNALSQDPAMDGRDLGKAVADGYFANLKRKALRQSLYSTLSVVDLSQAPVAAAALTDFANALDQHIVADTRNNAAEQLARLGQLTGRARYETPAFGRRELTDPGLTFDLGLLADNAAKFIGDERVARSAALVRAALAKAVVYKVAGDGLKDLNLSGLSIFLPIKAEATQGQGQPYKELPATAKTNWPNLVRAFADASRGDTKPPVVAQPRTDMAVVAPGSNGATISGQVADETIVTGVVVGVVGLQGKQSILLNFDEQPRTYRSFNEFNYVFDGMGWYLDDGAEPQLVFTVQWRPGQRAVFGKYQQSEKSKVNTAYFVYDESTGALLEGFEAVGGALGALLPADSSRFQPFLYTPELKRFETRATAIARTTLKKAPLPNGEYLVTVTGFDIGNNASTAGVLVAVRREGVAPTAQAGRTCQASDLDASSAPGSHDVRLPIASGETKTLALLVDRARIGQVRYVVDVFGGDGRVNLRNIGPDDKAIGASGRVSGHAADSFRPVLSGVYQLELVNEGGGDKTLFLSWTVSPAADMKPPQPSDLDRNPDLVNEFEKPGLHAGKLTVPRGQSLTVSLDIDKTKTPWLGYSIEAPGGPQPLEFAVLSADKKVQVKGAVCGLHMGGFAVPQTGEHQFVFDNSKGGSDRLVTIWIEGYMEGALPATPSNIQTLSEWLIGEHSQDFIVPPNQTLRLAIPFDRAKSSRVDFTLLRVTGLMPIKYQVLGPDGASILDGTHDYMAQGSFAISRSGEFAFVLDNSLNNTAKTVKLSLFVAPTITGAQPPEPSPGPGGPPAAPPGPQPGVAPNPGGLVVIALPEWSTGEHSRDLTLAPGQILRLSVPFDSSLVSRSDILLYQGAGIRYQVLAPDGMALLDSRHGFMTQEAFPINSSGEHVIVLDNSANNTSRTVKLSLYVKSR